MNRDSQHNYTTDTDNPRAGNDDLSLPKGTFKPRPAPLQHFPPHPSNSP